MRIRKGLVALVAAVTLVGTGAALAAYRTGSYTGRTAQRLSITFHAGTRSVTGLTYAVRYQEFLDGIEPSEQVYHRGDPAAAIRAALRSAAGG